MVHVSASVSPSVIEILGVLSIVIRRMRASRTESERVGNAHVDLVGGLDVGDDVQADNLLNGRLMIDGRMYVSSPDSLDRRDGLHASSSPEAGGFHPPPRGATQQQHPSYRDVVLRSSSEKLARVKEGDEMAVMGGSFPELPPPASATGAAGGSRFERGDQRIKN